MLGGVDFFKDFYVVSERGNATPVLKVYDLKSNKATDIGVPEPVYNISLSTNREFDTQKVRYAYQSFITPGRCGMTSFQFSRPGAETGAETSLKLRAPFSFVRM